ncbi:MAG: Gfo/Idh/MocA family oxidoreductase, partial [Clostridia bacterium]|nr:Gfo/Idh/MocA family oxidoreductase [Clostridia bacterium]
TYREFERVIKTAESKNLVVQLGYMYRYNNGIKKCLELIKEGRLGEIYSINAEMSTFHDLDYKRWLTEFDGGLMYILGCHLVDLILYILGKPDKITSYFKKTGLDGVSFPDNNLVVMEYKKALARVFVSSVEVNGWGRRQFFVSGSKGSIDIKPIENKISAYYSDLDITGNNYSDNKIKLNIEDIPSNCRYDEMMKDFYEYITGTKINPYTYKHELLLKKVMDRICKKGV